MNTMTNPILLFIAIILTMIASFTAFDLLLLLQSARRNRLFLFLGSVFSMGIGIWVTSFFGVLARDLNHIQSYEAHLIVLAMIVGLLWTALGFWILRVRKITRLRLSVASIFFTFAVLFLHMMSMYGMQVSIAFHATKLILAIVLLFFSFFFSVWLLFIRKYDQQLLWLKPLAATFVTIAIMESHFLLVDVPVNGTIVRNSSGNFMLYMMLLASLVILGSLVISTTLISKRLASSNTDLHDIKFALDQSSIIAFTNRKGIITSVNDKFCEISKYSREELIGQDHRILNSHYHPPTFFKEMWKTIGSGQVWKGNICNKAKDGTFYWVATTIVPFMNAKGKPYQYLAIRTDITEQKETEMLLHQQEKLAVVGQMAAGIAHEIRNPLTSMKGYAEFLQLDEQEPARREYLEIILEEADRINEIVEDFLVIAKPKVVQLERQNIVPIVHDVLTLMDVVAQKQDIILHYNGPQVVLADCDANRLKQVLLNLVKNAMEAIPGQGDVFVDIFIEEDIHLTVRDTGIGMSEEKRQQVGNPFFTTKKNGNGLGLMVSYKIIEGHHGRMTVESKEQIGTTFHLTLPLSSS